MFYRLIRAFLFLFDAESIHYFTFRLLRIVGKTPGGLWLLAALFDYRKPALEIELLGLKFKNRVGLAAGFDKNARHIDELASFGFGCIEIGTLTPVSQAGNVRPRLFRLPEDQGLINRMGFNNAGAFEAVAYLKKRKPDVIIGGNIGKNKSTPNDNAIDDYIKCIDALHPYVDYFVVNVSSPNTPGLRELQEKEPLKKLLDTVKALVLTKEKPRPVLLKIAPDLTDTQLDDIIQILKETKTDGIIATNTTLSREGLTTSHDALEKMGAGGLSGRPLRTRATAVISHLRNGLGPLYPIIGVGGIMTPAEAFERIQAGADLVQVYTGFVYEGPSFVKKINKFLVRNPVSNRRS